MKNVNVTTGKFGEKSFIYYLSGELIKYTLPVLYLLIAVMFYLKTYDSCQIKITLTQIGGTLLLSLWLIKLLESPEEIKRFYFYNLTIVLPVILYLIIGLYSHFVVSPLKEASWEPDRRVIYMGIVLLTMYEMNSLEKFSRLFRWLFAALFIATFYGIIQYLDVRYFLPNPEPGLDPFIWRHAFGPRVFSTFGNPNFYGDFLVVMGPVALALFLKNKNPLLLILWLMTSFNTYHTYSKGAWIGYVAAHIFLGFFYIIFFSHLKLGKIKRYVVIASIFTVLITGYGVYFQLTQRVASAKFRIFTWLSCWEMINTSPIVGTGIGTFYTSYPAWRRPQIFYIEGKHNTESDHPENEYLEVWFDEGTIGFGIFLWLLATCIFSGIKGLKIFSKPTIITDKKGRTKQITEDIRSYYMLGLLSGWLGSVTHNTVCVSLRFVSSGTYFWLFVGLIFALVVNNPLPQVSEEKNVISSTLALFIILLFWLINFLWWKMDTNIVITIIVCLFILGIMLEMGIKPSPVVEHKNFFTNPAIHWKFFQIVIIILGIYFVNIFRGYFVGDIHHNIAIFFSKQGRWSEALTNYNIVAKHRPGFIMCRYFMGNVFNDRWILNREYHPEWGDKENDISWCEIDLGKKGRIDPERSIANYERVWYLAPNYVQSHHQAGLVYMKLGTEFKNRADETKSVYYYNKALEYFWKYHKIDPIFPVNYHRMAWIYLQLGDIQKAEQVYKGHLFTQWLCQNPEDVINPKKIKTEEERKKYEELKLQFEEEKNWFCCDYHKREHYLLATEDWARGRAHEYSDTYLQLGNLKYVNGNFSEAEKFYIRAIKRYSGNLQAWKNLIVLYRQTNQKDKLEKIIQEYRNTFPEDINLSRLSNI